MDHSAKLNEALAALEELSEHDFKTRDVSVRDLQKFDHAAFEGSEHARREIRRRGEVPDGRRGEEVPDAPPRVEPTHPANPEWTLYTVRRRGESLSEIAISEYRLERHNRPIKPRDLEPYWMLIYWANKERIDANDDKEDREHPRRDGRPHKHTIYRGDELKIPYLRYALAEE